MKITDLTEDGRIVKGVNTTPKMFSQLGSGWTRGETERQAKKLFPMNKDGKPVRVIGCKENRCKSNVAFNLKINLTEDELTTVQRAELCSV